MEWPHWSTAKSGEVKMKQCCCQASSYSANDMYVWVPVVKTSRLNNGLLFECSTCFLLFITIQNQIEACSYSYLQNSRKWEMGSSNLFFPPSFALLLQGRLGSLLETWHIPIRNVPVKGCNTVVLTSALWTGSHMHIHLLTTEISNEYVWNLTDQAQ